MNDNGHIVLGVTRLDFIDVEMKFVKCHNPYVQNMKTANLNDDID